jgi:hypothetical protein
MVELLSLSHAGVRCALPSRQVVAAEEAADTQACVSFWKPQGRRETSVDPRETAEGPSGSAGRALRIVSADGPAWIHAREAHLVSVPSGQIYEITPVLRQTLRLTHVVGLAEINGELLWLVDARRFHPAEGQ